MTTIQQFVYDELLIKYSPILYFKKDEKYFPIDVEFYLKNGKLIDNNQEISLNPTIKDLYNYSQSKYPNLIGLTNIFISLPDQYLVGLKDLSAPVYCFYKETENTIDLYYCILYAYNEGKNILKLVRSGDHEGDLEVLIVELDKTSLNINRLYLGAHGTEDGRWVKKNEIEFEDNHPILYVAKGGHGMYGKAGFAFRYGGLANDFFSKDIKWKPIPLILRLKDQNGFNIERDGWIYFAGRWGDDGISSIADKGWFDNKPDPSILKPPPVFNTYMKISYFTLLISILLGLLYVVKISAERSPKKIVYFTNLFSFLAIIGIIVRYVVKKYA